MKSSDDPGAVPAHQENPLYSANPASQDGRSPRGWPARSSEGEVPEVLKEAVIYALDMGALLAGTPTR